MGFYGNITNVNKTTFTFDKIYRNRKEMDDAIKGDLSDGVFIGRYVLIEYDENADTFFPRVYKQDNKFYTSFNCEEETRVRFSETQSEDDNAVTLNDIVYVLDGTGQNATRTFYKCIDKVEENGIVYAVFEETELSDKELPDPYLQNYLIDSKAYPDMKRGYDSTVWQKVFDEGAEKYVNIAELNSVVPTFDLTIDAPTQSPLTPHFDADSTDVYYKLHVQPQWGFKVAHATKADIKSNTGFSTEQNINYPSDETASYTKYSYNKSTGQLETKTDSNYNAAIYYNKAGFDKDTITYSDELIGDEIKIAPTGKSGDKYNSHDRSNPNATEVKIDTQELSIMLPSLGDSVAEMWNIIYGDENVNNSIKRNTDVNWDSIEGLRFIKESENGYQTEKDEITTVAGCINSIHDLMGMIIIEAETSDSIKVKDALTNRIYYGNLEPKKTLNGQPYKSFYIKDKTYSYEKGNERTITPINDIRDFSAGQYYYFANDNYYIENNGYRSGNTYYDLTGKVDLIETIIDSYEPGKYYYQPTTENGTLLPDYHIEFAENPDETKTYYKIKLDSMIPITGSSKETGNLIQFFKPIANPVIKNEDGTYNKGPFDGYFYQDPSSDRYILIKETATFEEIENFDCYWIEGYTITADTEAETDEEVYTYDVKTATVNKKIVFIKFEEDKNYYSINNENKSIIKLNYNDIDHSIIYYQFGENTKTKIEGLFYEPDTYYYLNEAGNYIFAKEEHLIEKYKDKYYKITDAENLENVVFYEPDKYYYKKAEDDYEIDTKETMSHDQYYDISELYVISDENNVFAKGSIWNINVEEPPEGVILGTRTEEWEWKELDGFARNLNTIHGLIIEINNILKTDDKLTRDRQTVQGCINIINDLIDKIDTLIPAHFIIVDEYGRMKSSPWTTKQIFNSYNYGNGNITADIEDVDMWIKLDIDDNHKNPMVTINHTYHPVGETTTISDKNTGIENENAGINNNTNDTIELYTPIVDNMGHIVGDNTEIVTLPYGYKTIKTNGRGNSENENATSDPSIIDIVADSTQDVLTINSGNKWIRIDSDSDNDTITISHDIHEIDSAAADPTDLNDGTDTITIQDINFDTAGHVISNKNHTYTLPFGYKSFKDSEENPGQTDAETTQSTMTLVGDDWIKPSVSAQDTLKYEHIGPVKSNEVKSEDADKTPLFGETFDIEDWYFDEKGHKSNRLTHTIKIPTGSLEDSASTNVANVLTSIDFTPSTGAIKTTHENLSQLILTGYEKIDNNADVSAKDTLSVALSKLQTQIIEEEEARAAAISSENESRTKDIKRIDEALNLLNGDASTVGSVANTTATEIAKIVNDNNNGSIDTLNEIAAWIINDTTGAAKMNADIGINATNIALNAAAIELLETSTVSIATYEAKIAELEQEILTVNSRCNVLDKEVKNLINKVAELEAKLDS